MLNYSQGLRTLQAIRNGASSLDEELTNERAEGLARTGRTVQAAIAALAAEDPASPNRPTVLQDAADATWKYFVQREACGMRNHDQAIADYGITPEVLGRVGVQQRR